MARLSIYLPPFASDYTGVCASLYDLDCLTAINDASCCTEHYVYYDEPRWTEKQRPVFSTQLRTVDAVFGNDEKVEQSVLDMIDCVHTEIAALVGTPVPGMTGMDMAGLAAEIESRCSCRVFGFNTNGNDYYDKGIEKAAAALADRFSGCTDRTFCDRSSPDEKIRVNILGMTPLDYGNAGNDKDFDELLKQCGAVVNAHMFMGGSLEEIKRLDKADLNLAVSSSGVKIASHLYRKYKTPFLAAAPVDACWYKTVLKTAVRTIEKSGKTTEITAGLQEFPEGRDKTGQDGNILIINDQVIANSLRESMYFHGVKQKITAATFFGFDKRIAKPGDFCIPEESALIKELRSGKYTKLIGDPVLSYIPETKKLEFVSNVHPAMSGKLHWKEMRRFLWDQR